MRDVIRPLVSSRSIAVYSAPGADDAVRTIGQFRADGHAVGVIAQSQNRKEDQLFELAEIHRTGHLNCIVVQINERSSCV